MITRTTDIIFCEDSACTSTNVWRSPATRRHRLTVGITALLFQHPRDPCWDASTGLWCTGDSLSCACPMLFSSSIKAVSKCPSSDRAQWAPGLPDLPYWALATPSKASPEHCHQHTHQGAVSLFCRNVHPHAQLLAILLAKKREARQIFWRVSISLHQ